jgi:phosphatidylinositol 4-kinase B
LAHIDFGFMLTNTPGSMGFELAPFKITQEFLDILGGYRSSKFQEFRALLKEGFLAVQKRADSLLTMIEIMEKGELCWIS